MRRAFLALDAEVLTVDTPGMDAARAILERGLPTGPIDLVYERYALASGTAFEFAKRAGIPFVLEVNAPLEDEEARYRESAGKASPDQDLRRAMFRDADLVLAVSSSVASYALKSGATTENVQIRPNGVDLDRFKPRRDDDPLRGELAPEGSFLIGFHGRLRPWHNLPMLVSVVHVLLEEGALLHLLLIGEGDYSGLVEGVLPPETCTIRPWVPHSEIGSYVACYDALVMTHSARVPFYFSPLKLYEAMAAAVVPVAPRLGDLASLLEHGRNACLFEPDDEQSLISSLRELIEEPGLRAEIARGARSLAVENSWEGIARDVLTVRGGRA